MSVTFPAIPVKVKRISGTDRYQVALNASRSTFPTGGVSTAVIASGENWGDGFAASALAGTLRSPVLLVQPKSLPTGLVTELRRLKTKRVYIVGSTKSVRTAVTAKLRSAGFSVTRIPGANRFEVAENVARKVEALRGNNKVNQVLVVRGDVFYDALSVSALAYSRKLPILYTSPGGLNSHTASAIRALDVDEVLIGGNTLAVRPTTARAIGRLHSVDRVTRWGGKTIADTAYAVENGALARGWLSYAFVGTTNCYSYYDGLSAGPAVGYRGGALLPVTKTGVPAGTQNLLTSHKAEIRELWLIGRPSTAYDAVLSKLRALVE